jgi:hypothetical protein
MYNNTHNSSHNKDNKNNAKLKKLGNYLIRLNKKMIMKISVNNSLMINKNNN